jgi:hypothetical protein
MTFFFSSTLCHLLTLLGEGTDTVCHDHEFPNVISHTSFCTLMLWVLAISTWKLPKDLFDVHAAS